MGLSFKCTIFYELSSFKASNILYLSQAVIEQFVSNFFVFLTGCTNRS